METEDTARLFHWPSNSKVWPPIQWMMNECFLTQVSLYHSRQRTTHAVSKTSRWWQILVQSCLYCVNCTKFGQLIFRKIIKIVASRCQILWLKCTKFDFGRGSAPDPLGSLQRSPDPLAGLRGPTSKGRGGKEGKKRGGDERGQWRIYHWATWAMPCPPWTAKNLAYGK